MIEKKGSALIALLVIFVIVSVVMVFVFSSIVAFQNRLLYGFKRLESKLIAEAGLEDCLFMLNENLLREYEYKKEFGKGEYVIKVVEDIDNERFSIESTGYLLNAQNSPGAEYYLRVEGRIENNRYIIEDYYN